MSDVEGEKDLADIEVTEPPAGWSPAVVDGEPNPGDVIDLDEEPEA